MPRPLPSHPVAPLFSPALAGTFLEGKNRDWWQKPDQVIAALKLKPGEAVADIGAGSGYFLPYLSQAVGTRGKVYAEEIQEEFLGALQQRADKLGNVVVVKGTPENPKLPVANVDCLFLLTVYHEVQHGTEFLRTLRRFAKPGAKLVLIDFDASRKIAKGEHPAPKGHSIPESTVIAEATAAGWHLSDQYEFLGSEFYLVFM